MLLDSPIDLIEYSVKNGEKERRINRIYINPDFRRKIQLPDLAIIELDDHSYSYLIPLWDGPKEFFCPEEKVYPQESVGKTYFYNFL